MENRLDKRLKLDFPKYAVTCTNSKFPYVYMLEDKTGCMVAAFNVRILYNEITIDNIVVCKHYRNQGIFKKLNFIFESMFDTVKYSEVININLGEYLLENGFERNVLNNNTIDFVKNKK